jgi:hypothetical protein
MILLHLLDRLPQRILSVVGDSRIREVGNDGFQEGLRCSTGGRCALAGSFEETRLFQEDVGVDMSICVFPPDGGPLEGLFRCH